MPWRPYYTPLSFKLEHVSSSMEGKMSGKSAENGASRFARAAESAAEKCDKCELGRGSSAPKNGAGPSLTEISGSSLGIHSGSTNREALCRSISVRGSSSARAPEKVVSQGDELYFYGEEFWDAETGAAIQCFMASLMKNSK